MNSHDYEDLVREFHAQGFQVGLSIETELDPTGPLMQHGKRITMSLDQRASKVFSDEDIEAMSKDEAWVHLNELLGYLRKTTSIALQLHSPEHSEEETSNTDSADSSPVGDTDKGDPRQDPDDFDGPEAPVGEEDLSSLSLAELLGMSSQRPQRSDLEVRLSTLSILMAQRSSAPTDAELQRVYNWVLGKETDDDRG